MMHLITPELDKGLPVTYYTYSIKGEPFDRYWKQVREKPIDEIKRVWAKTTSFSVSSTSMVWLGNSR